MKKIKSKIIILLTMFLSIFAVKYSAYADGNGILIKTNSLEDLSIFVTVKYGEGNIATVYLNKSNNFSEQTQITAQDIHIEEFIITNDEGEVTANYKAYGVLTDNIFDIVIEKVDDKEPIKNEDECNYDGSVNGYNKDNKDIGDVDVIASVPEDFYSNINIFFIDDYGNNVSCILRYPEYKEMLTQRTGILKLKEIKIIDDMGQYSIKAEEELEIKKDETVNYKIDIKLQELDSIGEKVPTDEEREEDKLESQSNKEINSNNFKSSKSIFSKVIVTVIVIGVLGGVYLFIKLRKDCD